MSAEKRIIERLSFLYGNQKAPEIFEKILEIKKKYSFPDENKTRKAFTEKDAILITYGDQVTKEAQTPLFTLNSFFTQHCSDVINTIHVLPFYPYSSDDGFSVIDYKSVNQALGNWGNVEELGENFKLMFDAVINHISAKSDWFKAYRNGLEKAYDYFIEREESADYSQVFRPRDLPLFSEFKTKNGTKHLWTTFSPDQLDLNYKSPELLLEVIDILLFYASKGASLIRLDAVAFLWKEPGTTCAHLPQTHELVKLFRDILDISSPSTSLLTETNVPHKDNIKYFGNGNDEAQMVYNFSLPPLTAHAILREDSKYITDWAYSLSKTSNECVYFNFTASHDGIGVVPANGLIPDKEIAFLCFQAIKNGGKVSRKSSPEGKSMPYELNINYMEMLKDENDTDNSLVEKFMLSQAIMLAIPGVPGIYFHSLFGSSNYLEGVKKTGMPRSINREKFYLEYLEEELSTPNSIRSKVFQYYKSLLRARKDTEEFNPSNPWRIPYISSKLFTILRYSSDKKSLLLAANNLSSEAQRIDISDFFQDAKAIDIISGKIHENSSCKINARQTLWLKSAII
jgi:sucrose phosphorylase